MIKYTMKEFKAYYPDNNDSHNVETGLDNKVEGIVEDMNSRRPKTGYLSAEKISEYVFSKNPEKPGKIFEFEEEFRKSGGNLTVYLALKMADMIFYSSQINAPWNVKNKSNECEERLGISHELAQRFFIVKYENRTEQPLGSYNYKEVERVAMRDFFNNADLLFTNEYEN